MELEKQLAQYKETVTNSTQEEEKLGQSLLALKTRRKEMEQELREFEKAVRDSQIDSSEKADFERTIERKVEKAQIAVLNSIGSAST